MNEHQLRRLFPNASRSTIEANASLPPPEPQRDKTPALDKTTEGEAQSLGRVVVRFTQYRVQLLDDDNLAGSIKDLLDGVKHSHLIRDDSSKEIDLQVNQIKVQHHSDERTEIEITWP
jgi:hypothetical protein